MGRIRLPKPTYQRPVLSDELETRISDVIQTFEHRGRWKEWGLDKVREQGVALLLYGPPGTGKTMTAYYIAKRLHLGIREVSVADYGSQIPGQLARNIKTIFNGEIIAAQQDKKHESVIFLDECDSMLVSRNHLGHDMMWMLEPITALLTWIAKYPGLVILATNRFHSIDEALERRLLDKIEIDRPHFVERKRIWQIKWPAKFPTQPIDSEFDDLAVFPLSGAEIENEFLLWAGWMIRNNETPFVSSLINKLSRKFEHEPTILLTGTNGATN